MSERYSINESLRRIFKVLRGDVITNGTPEAFSGDEGWNESLNKIVELLQDTFLNGSVTLPFSFRQGKIVDADGTLADITAKFNDLLDKLKDINLLDE